MVTKESMTPELLEKLKIAREKALQVRQEKAAKVNELKRLEKEAAEKELNDKLAQVKAKVAPPPPQEVTSNTKQESKPKPKTPPKKKKADVIAEIIEEPDSDSSGSEDDDSDDDDAIAPVKVLYKNKYKQKYKNKYQAKAVNQLTRGVAQQQLRKKIDEEVYRAASLNLFGNM